MIENGFIEPDLPTNGSVQFDGATIHDLKLNSAITIDVTDVCKSAVDLMRNHGFDQLPVVKDGQFFGLITIDKIMYQLFNKNCTLSSQLSSLMTAKETSESCCFEESTTLDKLQSFFNKSTFGVINKGKIVLHVVTKVDLVTYMMTLL